MATRHVLLSLVLLCSLIHQYNCLPTENESSSEMKDELTRLLRRLVKTNNDPQYRKNEAIIDQLISMISGERSAHAKIGTTTDRPTTTTAAATTITTSARAPAHCGTPAIKPKVFSARIIGGIEAEPHSWPWQCLVQTNTFTCGGSVIDNNYILTAAHCIVNPDNSTVPESEFTIICGIHNRNISDNKWQIFKNVSVVVHETFSYTAPGYDIAIIRLPSPLTFNDYVQPICIPSRQVEDGTECVVTGWGKTPYERRSSVLRQAVLPVVNFTACTEMYYGELPQYMMCAGYTDDIRATCSGDSGGPLVCKQGDRWFQHGVVNFGPRTCYGRPGVYTSVAKSQHWIEQVTGIGPSERKYDSSTLQQIKRVDELSDAEEELLDLLRRVVNK